MGARAQLEPKLSNAKQEAINTECLKFLVELSCQIKQRISFQVMKILSVSATHSQRITYQFLLWFMGFGIFWRKVNLTHWMRNGMSFLLS